MEGHTHKGRRWLPWAAGILVLGLVAGCAGKKKGQLRDPVDSRFAGFELTDRQIAQAVEKWLEADPAVESTTLRVGVADGVVTLEGTQRSYSAAQRAKFLAQTVRGVRVVVDHVDVEPELEMADEKIEDALEDAFSISMVEQVFDVEASVSGGVATLRGRVDAWSKSLHAQLLAANVRGVTEVVSDIAVHPDAERADAQIEEDVLAAIKWDARVRGGDIEVASENGKVRLRGTVPSAASKRLAVWDAGVEGALEVDGTELVVDTSEPRAGVCVVLRDRDIQAAVDRALLRDPRVSSARVVATARGGVVRLRGTVGSVFESRAALGDAYNTTGVTYVKNLLEVRRRTDVDDAEIAQLVRRSLRLDPLVPVERVLVEVDRGEVRLQGTVQSAFEKLRADVAAARVSGVVAVKNELDVEKPSGPLVFDPYLGDLDAESFSWVGASPEVVALSGEELEERIRARLWWSPYVTAEKIRVHVESGVARLEGEVDSREERQAAALAVLRAGAAQVINNLEL